MKKKVILISIDGMRPDGLLACGHPFVETMLKTASYTLNGTSVFPSVTLPCHMSIFHSVPPERHGITTNQYMPPVHPITGLMEQIKMAGGSCTMYYGWEPIRDVSRPLSLVSATFIKARAREDSDRLLTARALEDIRTIAPDFVFLYLVETDEKGGHDHGWMSNEYLKTIHTAIECLETVIRQCGEGYTVIVTADHGGHNRSHGKDIPEDMTIPMFFFGPDFTPGERTDTPGLLDIAPTVAKIMEISADPEWEGRSLI